MTKAYEAPKVEAVTPIDAPLIVGAGGSEVNANPQWTEEPDES